MYFTIERAGLRRNRFRARLFGANDELVWHTQTYADKRDATKAIDFIVERAVVVPIPVHDHT